jgi:hypothetical protein
MNEDHFNMAIRTFLKQMGVTSQRAIEQAITQAAASGSLHGVETFDLKMTLESPSIGLNHCLQGTISMT